MILDRVTMTGADDSIKSHDLIALSFDFPFVEFGILFSSSKHKTRFPSDSWLWGLYYYYTQQYSPASFNKPQFCAHICGKWVKDILSGKNTVGQKYSHLFSLFQRIQLNFHGEDHSKYFSATGMDLLKNDPMFFGKQIIFQLDNTNDELFFKAVERYGLNAVGLFDGSHGSGVVPDKWPEPHILSKYTGYSGGLGPDNLKSHIQKIEKVIKNMEIYPSGFEYSTRIWLDMETKIRSDDDRQFDLKKVRECLEIAKEFVV